MAARGEPRRRGARADRAAELLDSRRPPRSEAEAQLARTVAALRAVPAPAMAPAARAQARALLLDPQAAASPAPGLGAPPAHTGSAPAPRRVTRPGGPGARRALRSARPALIGALAASVTAVGVAVSAAHALPGELLYGVKRQVEQIQVNLAANRVDRAKVQLAVARTRMDELAAVVGPTVTASRTRTEHGGAGGRPAATGSAVDAGEADGRGAAAEPPSGGPESRGIPPDGSPEPSAASGRPAPEAEEQPTTPRAAGGSAPPGSSDPPDTSRPASSRPDTDSRPQEIGGRQISTATTLLRDWCEDAAAGSEVLIDEVRSGNADAWRILNDFAADQSARLDALLGAFPDSSAPEVAEARRIIREVGSVLTYPTPGDGSAAPHGSEAPHDGGRAPVSSSSDPERPQPSPSTGAEGTGGQPGPGRPAAERGQEPGGALPMLPRVSSTPPGPAGTPPGALDMNRDLEVDQAPGEEQRSGGEQASSSSPATPSRGPGIPASPAATGDDLPAMPDVLDSLRIFEAPAEPGPAATAVAPGPDGGAAGGKPPDGAALAPPASSTPATPPTPSAPSARATATATGAPRSAEPAGAAAGTPAAPPDAPVPGAATAPAPDAPPVSSTGAAPAASAQIP
ncbi:DUF5667 domain-containing protein [Parafrankia elaeagni]|uniref:DUF5667 domain-containing protein n=1 Tax=Parafrankia elaeagni TaxID=222534 RepID=UPI0003A0D9AF|nr:DUF5667 domain-containing protein [Parafrankia elaeagni]